MNTEKRILKPYHGIVAIALAAVDIFWFSSFLGDRFGLYGTLIHELILLLIAVGTVLMFRGDMKNVFPFRKPEASKIAGTLVFWMGAFWAVMMVTIVIAYFFPRQVLGIGAGLGSEFTSVPLLLSLLIVSVTPAICEEAVFRGTFLNSLWGGIHNKWVVMVIVSVTFGVFHGSIWRFVPTALLGMALSYVLFETGNMFYNMLFHAVNNAVPIILIFVLEKIMGMAGPGMDSVMAQSEQMTRLPLLSVASYMLYGGAAPFLLYIGDYLLHKGRPGYVNGLFPREKRGVLIALIAVSFFFVAVGFCMMVYSIVADQWILEQYPQFNQYL